MTETSNRGLAARLRHETQDLHRLAEKTGVMAALLHGRIDRPTYAGLMLNLQAIYGALEAGLDRHAQLPGIDFKVLYRAAAIADDLSHLPPAAHAALAPATEHYVVRLNALADQGAVALLAHAYVRYLGDLHGGQILQRLVARALGMVGDAGTRFYDFGTPDRVATLVRGFRHGLDTLHLEPPQADALVAEARWAFQRHVELFGQLAH